MRTCKCGCKFVDDVKACPVCGRRYISGPVKFIVWLVALGFLAAVIIASLGSHGGDSAPSAPEPDRHQAGLSHGNNKEAERFASTMTKVAEMTWPEGMVVWHLDLTPKLINGDVVPYRRSVSHCKAEVTMGQAWYKEKVSSRRFLIQAWIDALHKPPVLTSGILDYYPNSSGELIARVDGRVVARGAYSKTKTIVHLEGGAPSQNATPTYKARVEVFTEGGRVTFKALTNLPDSESVLVTLERPGSYSGQSKVRVNNGSFTTETFSDDGRSLSSGNYSLQFNVFNPRTGLMVEARAKIILFRTKKLKVYFHPRSL